MSVKIRQIINSRILRSSKKLAEMRSRRIDEACPSIFAKERGVHKALLYLRADLKKKNLI